MSTYHILKLMHVQIYKKDLAALLLSYISAFRSSLKGFRSSFLLLKKGYTTANITHANSSPLNIITGCISFHRNSCKQKLSMIGEQSLTLLWRNFGTDFFTELLEFSHIVGLSSMNCLLKVPLQHLSGVDVQNLSKPCFF